MQLYPFKSQQKQAGDKRTNGFLIDVVYRPHQVIGCNVFQ